VIRQEMQLVKDMGANFIRLAHYQQSRLVLELCDRLGLLVWEEVPWCRSGVVSDTFRQQGITLLTRMIDQHRNHPSILLWGLGNEDDWPTEPQGNDHAAIRQYMIELRDLAHRLDDTRLTSFRRADFASDIPDVYSPSIWAGWYSGSYREYGAALEKARYSVPHLLHAEWGADSHAGRHAEDPDPAMKVVRTGTGVAETGFDYKLAGGEQRMSRDGEWSETYACELFDWYLKTSEQIPWLTGSAQWIFKDFTTPLRVDNPIPRVNQKGLLARDMTPKEGYFVFQSYWATKPMVHVYGHDWPVRWGRPGQARIARVYSNCAQVELFVNGVSQGVRHRDSTAFPCAGLRWYPAFRAGQNTVRAVAHADGQRIEDQVSFHYETEPWGAPAKLRLASTGFKPHSQESGRVVLLAELLDAHGKRCLDARQVVRFTVAGDAELLDNLGTTTGSRVVQLANGHIQITALLRTEAVIGVSCDGVAPAFLKLPVGPIVSPAALLEGAPVPRISVAEVSSRTDV
jgi:beta-galactosidase